MREDRPVQVLSSRYDRSSGTSKVSALLFDIISMAAAIRLSIGYHRLRSYVRATRGHRLVVRGSAFRELHFQQHLRRFARLAPYPYWTLTIILATHAMALLVMKIDGEQFSLSPNYPTVIFGIFAFAFAVHTVFVVTYELSEAEENVSDADVLAPFANVQSQLWRIKYELALFTLIVALAALVAYLFNLK